MENFRNIRVKDDSKETKLKAISAIRSAFGIPLVEAKEMYNKILDAGEVLYEERNFKFGPFSSNSWCYDPNLFGDINQYEIVHLIAENFDSDKEYVSEHDSRGTDYFTSRVPDDETAEALAWYEKLSDEDKKRVDLVGVWNTPIAYPCS